MFLSSHFCRLCEQGYSAWRDALPFRAVVFDQEAEREEPETRAACSVTGYISHGSPDVAHIVTWCWLRSSCIETVIPLGMWVKRTADSVLLTCCMADE